MGNQLVQVVQVVTGTPPTNQVQSQAFLVDAAGNALTPVKKQAAQADSVATTVGGLVTDFNALLAKLRTAGILS
jgi:hypothetical protein